MPRVPTAGRRARLDDDDDERTPARQLSLAARVLEDAKPPKLGRPPKDEEEKRSVFKALAYMKSGKLTNTECGQALDVSERSIVNYLNDPLYAEVQNELQSEAKNQGHTTISMLIDDALSVLYQLMHTAKSEFVSYKAAEKLLDVAGFNMPREEQQRDNREEVSRFLELVKTRASVNVQVNIQQVGEGETKTQVVDAELAPYYRPVLPGGKMPPEVPGD